MLLHRHLPVLSLSLGLAALACGSDTGNSGDSVGSSGGSGAGASGGSGASAGAGATAGTGGSGSLEGETFTTTSAEIGPVNAPIGGEDTVCIYKRLGNVEGGFARRIRGHLTDGSHHMIVYLSQETEEQLEPEPCGGFSGILNLEGGIANGGIPGLDSKDIPVFIAQKHEEELVMPRAPDYEDLPVGFRIEPNQMLRIELHWFNTTGEVQDVVGSVDFDMVSEDTEVMESQFAFWGTGAIDIPPQTEYETPVLFQRALTDTTAFAVTTHQHRRGTRMRVWHSDTNSGDGKRLLADNSDWAEPPLEMLEPQVRFDVGEGLAYQCEWANFTDKQVGFGEDFDDEMCFLWMYYYPSLGFDFCVNLDGGTGGICNHLVR